jgi:hypothetical protein
MLIYISGAITNDPNYKDKFAKAEKRLTDKGHKVINPAKVAESLPELKHEQYLHIDESLIDICDAAYFLKDWKESDGAQMEHTYINILKDNYENGVWNQIVIKTPKERKLIFEGDNEDEL